MLYPSKATISGTRKKGRQRQVTNKHNSEKSKKTAGNQRPQMLVNASSVSPPDVVPQFRREKGVPCLLRSPLINPRVISKACFFCHIMDFQHD